MFGVACICQLSLHMPRIPLTPTYVIQSFQKLVGLLNDSLLVDQEMASLRGGAIIPELCVYITLQYLAGGSYMDIFFLVVISKSSFFMYN